MAQKKLRRNTQTVGQERLNQIKFLETTGADAITGDVLAPGKVITTDVSAGGVFVGAGSILRIQANADTYIAFGESNIGSVSSSTSPAFKHPGGYVLLNATGDYVRASAAFTRLEVMADASEIR